MIVQVGLGHETSTALTTEELPYYATLMFFEQLLIREGLVANGAHERFVAIGGSVDRLVQVDQVTVVLEIRIGCELFLAAAALLRLLQVTVSELLLWWMILLNINHFWDNL